MPSRAKPHALSPDASVVELDAFRETHRLRRYRERVGIVLEQNRRAVERLYESGLMFTRHGSRIGRDLLTAHRHLLRVADLVERAADGDPRATLRSPADVDRLFTDIETLLEKTSVIARRHKSLFQSEPGT